MEDTCAMHLSYVLANHSLPEQLLLYVPTAKSGPAQQLEVYDTRFGCHGIVYLPNDKLGSAGIKVLEMAEFARERSSDESAQGNQSPSKTPARTAGYPRRVSDATFSLPTGQAQGQRRSTVSSGSIDHSTYAGRGSVVTNELDRARSRIQSNVLKECGSQAVELWSASLKMLNIARQILPAGRRRQSEGSYHRQRDVSVDFSRLRPTYASKLMVGAYVPGEPVLNITGISSNPTTPTVLQRRKASTSDAPTGRGRSADMSSDLQMSRLSVMIKTSPEGSPMPFGLPEKLWGRIIALAADAIGVVNEVQQDSILRWATDRDTLIREMDALGKPESEQIWRLLEGMGCLAYVSDLDALLEG